MPVSVAEFFMVFLEEVDQDAILDHGQLPAVNVSARDYPERPDEIGEEVDLAVPVPVEHVCPVHGPFVCRMRFTGRNENASQRNCDPWPLQLVWRESNYKYLVVLDS